jgi:deoxyribonuclease-4
MKVSNPCLKVGAHLSISGGIHNVFAKAQQLDCNAIQLFLKNNNRWWAKPLDSKNILLFKQQKASSFIEPIIAHAGYLANLASPDKIKRKKSIENIIDDILRCCQLGIYSLIIHPGAHLGAGISTGIKNLINSLISIKQSTPPIEILIETSPGSGTQICHSFQQISKVIDNVDSINVCIDTCHIFAAGYNINAKTKFYSLIKEINTTIGLERLKVIHLNDSKYPCGSKIDRHQHIGKGYIKLASFKRIVKFAANLSIPLIIETPKELNENGVDMDIINLSLIKKLYQSP